MNTPKSYKPYQMMLLLDSLIIFYINQDAIMERYQADKADLSEAVNKHVASFKLTLTTIRGMPKRGINLPSSTLIMQLKNLKLGFHKIM
jgi:hypothetical protein